MTATTTAASTALDDAITAAKAAAQHADTADAAVANLARRYRAEWINRAAKRDSQLTEVADALRGAKHVARETQQDFREAIEAVRVAANTTTQETR